MTIVDLSSPAPASITLPGSELAEGYGQARSVPLEPGRLYMLTSDGPVLVSSSESGGGVVVDEQAPQAVRAGAAAYARAVGASSTRLWAAPLVAPTGLQAPSSPAPDPLAARAAAEALKAGRGCP